MPEDTVRNDNLGNAPTNDDAEWAEFFGSLSHRLAEAKHQEALSALHLVRMKASYESLKASELAKAYGDGTISGKNADERKLQEIVFLEVHTAVATARLDLAEREDAHTALQAEATRLEMFASLYRAWLYSQSRREL